ncbi:exosortase/archaeosortase family protein [Marinobacter lacisalsi]|uniref:Exosortase/archaeosortase family protein n=1 Tax=Marinobacter lacisalsi TaxID=475979 RepID=A0ABV8QES5_9GAMM
MMLRKTLDQIPHSRPYLIVTAIGIVLFWPTWLRLVGEWLKWEQVLAHGLPTFLIFIGLLLIHPPRQPANASSGYSIIGSFALIIVVALWALLELVRIDTLTYLMLPAGLLSLSWALMGFSPALRYLPYVLLFSLSLPVWSDFVPLLVSLATAVVTRAVSALGITALIEGAHISLPYGRLVIADGCSGIRYFAISILLAMITAILNDFRWKGWLAAIATGAVVALLVNWVRITALVVIAYQSNMESSLVEDHETFGWLIYAAFIIPVMLLAPVRRRQGPPEGPGPRLPGKKGFAVVVAAFLLGPVGISLAHSRAGSSEPWAVTLPQGTPSEAEQLPVSLSLPENLEHQVWRIGPGGWISVAQALKAGRDEKLVPYLPPRVDGEQWFLTERNADNGVRIYQNLLGRRQVAVGERYHVGTYTTDSYRSAKLLQIPATLAGENRFALVTAQSPCSPRSCDSAIERVLNLMNTTTLEPPH